MLLFIAEGMASGVMGIGEAEVAVSTKITTVRRAYSLWSLVLRETHVVHPPPH